MGVSGQPRARAPGTRGVRRPRSGNSGRSRCPGCTTRGRRSPASPWPRDPTPAGPTAGAPAGACATCTCRSEPSTEATALRAPPVAISRVRLHPPAGPGSASGRLPFRGRPRAGRRCWAGGPPAARPLRGRLSVVDQETGRGRPAAVRERDQRGRDRPRTRPGDGSTPRPDPAPPRAVCRSGGGLVPGGGAGRVGRLLGGGGPTPAGPLPPAPGAAVRRWWSRKRRGRPAAGIAAELGVSRATVYRHMRSAEQRWPTGGRLAMRRLRGSL